METDATSPAQPPSEEDLRWFVRWAARQAARAERERVLLQRPQEQLGDQRALALREKAEQRALMLSAMIKKGMAFEEVVFPAVDGNHRVTVGDLRHVLLRRRLHELFAAESPNEPPTAEQRDARLQACRRFGIQLKPGQVSLVRKFDRFEKQGEPARLAKQLVEQLGGPASSIQSRVQTLTTDWPRGPLDSLSEKILAHLDTFRWAACDREGDCHEANREAAWYAVLEAFGFSPRTLAFLLGDMQTVARERLAALNREEAIEWVADRLAEQGLLEGQPPPPPECIFCGSGVDTQESPLLATGPVRLHESCKAKVDTHCPTCHGQGVIYALDAGRRGHWQPCLCGTGVRFNQPQSPPAPKAPRRRRRYACKT